MPSRRVRVAGRATNPVKAAKPSRGKRVVAFMRKPVAIVGTLVLAAVTAVVTTQAPQWFSQVGDNAERLDDMRTGAEIRTVVTKVWLSDEGRTMATPQGHLPDDNLRRALSQQGAGADDEVLKSIEQLGGVRVGNLSLQIIVEGRRNQQIRITNIAPEIVERSTPLAGTFFDMPGQGGDASLRMLLDLDDIRPVVREVTEDDTSPELRPGAPYFDTNTISLKDGEQQVIVLRTQANRSYFTFVLKVTYLIGGEPRNIVIDDNGEPFAVTARHYGPEPDTLSYEQAFKLQGDFSLCEVPTPSRIPSDFYCQ